MCFNSVVCAPQLCRISIRFTRRELKIPLRASRLTRLNHMFLSSDAALPTQFRAVIFDLNTPVASAPVSHQSRPKRTKAAMYQTQLTNITSTTGIAETLYNIVLGAQALGGFSSIITRRCRRCHRLSPRKLYTQLDNEETHKKCLHSRRDLLRSAAVGPPCA